MIAALVSRFARARQGGAAVEYAIVLPAFIVLLVGAFGAANLGFAINSLHYAVEDGARCAAVKTTICTDGPSTVTYAQSRYSGPQISPTFAYSASGCGHTVSATGAYQFMLGLTTLNVPLSASACYP